MATRHFINDGETLVQDALEGLVLTNPNLIYDRANKGEEAYISGQNRVLFSG